MQLCYKAEERQQYVLMSVAKLLLFLCGLLLAIRSSGGFGGMFGVQCCVKPGNAVNDTGCFMFSRQQLRRTILLLWQEQKTCTAKAWSRYDSTTFPKHLHANTGLQLPWCPLCVSTSVGEGDSRPGLVCFLHSELGCDAGEV